MSVARFNVNNLSSKKTFAKLSTIQEGSNLYRVLPPCGQLAEKVSRGENVRGGGIAKYWEIFWLEGSNGKKYRVPSILRTKNNGKGVPSTVLVEDPILNKYEELKKQLQDLENSGKANENLEVANYLKKQVMSLTLDKAYYVNVINPSGEISVLKVKVTAFQDLKLRLQELDNLGVDAVNPGPNNGIIFDFKKLRDEKGKVSYRVDVAKKTYKDPNTGRLVSEDQYMEIGDEVLKRMETEAADLENYYRIRTPQEMELLASLDQKTIDMVMSGATEVDEEPTEEPEVSVGAPTQSLGAGHNMPNTEYDSIVNQFLRR